MSHSPNRILVQKKTANRAPRPPAFPAFQVSGFPGRPSDGIVVSRSSGSSLRPCSCSLDKTQKIVPCVCLPVCCCCVS